MAIDLYKLALLLLDTNRLEEAELLMRRHLGIFLLFQKQTGHLHHCTKLGLNDYLTLTRFMEIADTEARSRLEDERQNAGLDAAVFENLWAQTLATVYNGPWRVTMIEAIAGGQGEALRLEAGDVFLRYNGVEITGVNQLIQLTTEAKADAIPLEIQRGDQVLKLTAKPGKLGVIIGNREPPSTEAAPDK